MSVMIVEPETVSILASFLSRLYTGGYDSFGFEMNERLRSELRDCEKGGTISEIKVYEKLYALNYEAYNYVYKRDGSCSNEEMPKYCEEADVWSPPMYANYHFVVQPYYWKIKKSLDFYIYQCYVDKIPPFVAALEELNKSITNFMVINSNEYNYLPWR